MAGLDFTGIRSLVNDWLVDTIRFERDNGVADDVLDEETGELIPPPAEVIYDGPGAVQPVSGFSEITDPNVATHYQESGATYRVLIPLNEPLDYRAGDIVKVTAVAEETGDPALVGPRWKVVEQRGESSFQVVRIIYLRPVA